MNKDNARLYLPLMQALADGKQIQVLYYPNDWHDLNKPTFHLPPERYRIKPEPFEAEVWVKDGGKVFPCADYHDNVMPAHGFRKIKVREVEG